ncbi:MAG: exo-alpha-sialidase, partial [Acidobacteriota bacterium]|nr:exo-alpha-sialidase [Acidobacteriota bacterium]
MRFFSSQKAAWLLVALLAGLTAPIGPSSGFGAAGWKSERTVFREKSGGYFTHRIPALLASSKGALLAFCEGRRGSASDSAPTDILLRRSLDGGKTWGPVQVVA